MPRLRRPGKRRTTIGLKPTSDVTREPSLVPGISQNVFLLSLVSMFTDLSSEMVYPLVPLFLSSVLGAPAAVLGVIEGTAETTASLLKWFAGALSDKFGKRKPFLLFGYGVAAASKLLLSSAFAWPVVLSARVLDRFGKGVRGSPRDALLADSAPAESRGRAFGFHRSSDSIGAVLGPLLALWMLLLLHGNYRLAFLIAVVPGVLSTLLILPVRDVSVERKSPAAAFRGWSGLANPRLRRFLVVIFAFSIGNSSDMFLILRASQLGASGTTVVLMFACCNLFSVLASYPAGVVSDRLGRKVVLIAGFLLFAAVYCGFGITHLAATLWVLFASYGVYQGLTDGVAKTFVVDIVPQSERGAALGLQAMVTGICTLPASVVAGLLWQYGGPRLAFLYGAVTAFAAAILMAVLFATRHFTAQPTADA